MKAEAHLNTFTFGVAIVSGQMAVAPRPNPKRMPCTARSQDGRALPVCNLQASFGRGRLPPVRAAKRSIHSEAIFVSCEPRTIFTLPSWPQTTASMLARIVSTRTRRTGILGRMSAIVAIEKGST